MYTSYKKKTQVRPLRVVYTGGGGRQHCTLDPIAHLEPRPSVTRRKFKVLRRRAKQTNETMTDFTTDKSSEESALL